MVGIAPARSLVHRRLVTEVGRAAGRRTLAVGYRLAPEHPFPAALDDALKAFRFARELGIAASGIAVEGDSAGGRLTLALISRTYPEWLGGPTVAAPSGSVPLVNWPSRTW